MSPRHTKKSRILIRDANIRKYLVCLYDTCLRSVGTGGMSIGYASWFSALGLEPKLSSMKLHEVLAKHQSQTGTFLVLRPVGREMRVLFQELVLILFLDALTGIFHANGYEIPLGA